MKSGLVWAYIASVVVHVAVVAAVSWLQVSASTAPARAAWVEVSFVEAGAGGTVAGSVDEVSFEEAGVFEAESGGSAGASPSPWAAVRESGANDVEAERSVDPGRTHRSAPTDERRVFEAGSGGSVGASPSPWAAARESGANDAGAEESADAGRARRSAPAVGQQSIAREQTTEGSAPAVARVVEPVYPRSARRAGHEGKVIVEVMVLANGRVGDVAVVESSGYGELDEAAVKAAKKSRFVAATLGGVAVDSQKRLAFRFVLEDGR